MVINHTIIIQQPSRRAKLARKRKALKSKESKDRKKLREKLDKIKKQLECKKSIYKRGCNFDQSTDANINNSITAVKEDDEGQTSKEIQCQLAI
ncbi:hypothetical protein FGO68_gene9459 [Halteria grandinella]|uniref:Uncharacterized protein n=1 Tax=Halteria grandinella TaxID=5974 RepID=A0A8J8STZ8_HALGN|nr:hypothetical protein FGO68_gene9459 [Halteria grandinella]